jgi:hypothetical protein
MLAGCLLIGFTVIVVAVWLEYNDSLGWPNEVELDDGGSSDVDNRYRSLRRRWRLVVHVMIAVCGALMASAGLAGLGRYWVAAWTAVAILMLTIILIALGDAIRTRRYYASKKSRNRNLQTTDLTGS